MALILSRSLLYSSSPSLLAATNHHQAAALIGLCRYLSSGSILSRLASSASSSRSSNPDRPLLFPSFSPLRRPGLAAAASTELQAPWLAAIFPSLTRRGFATSSVLSDPNPNLHPRQTTTRPPRLAAISHLLVTRGFATSSSSSDNYIRTLTKVVGSEEEAKMKIYSVIDSYLSRCAPASFVVDRFCPSRLRTWDDAAASIRPRSASISPLLTRRGFATSSVSSDPNPNLHTEETTSNIKTLTKVVGSKPAAPPESNSSPPPESNSSATPEGREPTLKAAVILYLAYCTPFYLVHLMLKHFFWSDIEQSINKRNNVAGKIEEMKREVEVQVDV